ncbi:xaa-Pro aminopeptidase 1-like isoform X2 [Amblyomma americanum]
MRRCALASLLLAAIAVKTTYGTLPPTILDDAGNHKSPFYMFSKPEESRPSCVFGVNHSVSPLRVNTTARLTQLRHLLSKENFQGYIVPSEDAHNNEFVPPHYKRRQYLTGFSGETGTAVVLMDFAAVWVEGRYMLQAEEELDCNWVLMNGGQPDVPVIEEWLKSNLHGPSRVGVDSRIVPFQEYRRMEESLHPFGIELIGEPRHLVDEIWTPMEGRPYEVNSTIVTHSVEFAGESWQDKVRKVREFLKKSGIDAILVTDLGEIAWLYNLRGNDVPYTPVFEAFVFLSQDEQKLYVNPQKMTSAIRNYLIMDDCNNWACVQWKDYKLAYNEMNINGNSVNRLLVSPFCSYAICGHIDVDKLVVSEAPIKMMMTVKNNAELRGIRKAHTKDSVVFVTMLAHMERDFTAKKPWTEARVIYELERIRSHQPHYRGESFSSVAAVGPNAAAPAHHPRNGSGGYISNASLVLVDSGAQYLDGTTDIARTVHFGTPTEFEKEVYTRVLMGMIDMFLTVFPEGTKDNALDVVARRALWSVGLDFLHGVSHGLGAYMTAHERPPLISPYSKGHPLLPGMVLSNEPGYYEEDKLGVRLETAMEIVPANTTYRFMSHKFCKFEPLTFVPFQASLIKWELLNKEQLAWLNYYNSKTLEVVGAELKRLKRHDVLAWLQANTFRAEIKNGSVPVLRVAGHHGLLSPEGHGRHHAKRVDGKRSGPSGSANWTSAADASLPARALLALASTLLCVATLLRLLA